MPKTDPEFEAEWRLKQLEAEIQELRAAIGALADAVTILGKRALLPNGK